LQAVLEGADLIWFAERRRFLCDPFAQDHARRTPAPATASTMGKSATSPTVMATFRHRPKPD
jgi:hypothetical protein